MDPNRFFGVHIDSLTLGGKATALLLSVLLSGLVGFERQWRGQPAGLRTHILVAIGSTLITITSVEFGIGGAAGRGDAARIAAQIVSGIGFLGAGAILRDGTTVHGLTTAASIWAVAAIGIAVGASPRLGEVAVVGTTIVLVTLVVLTWLEESFNLKPRNGIISAEIDESDHDGSRLLELLAREGLSVQGVTKEAREPTDAGRTRKMEIRVRVPVRYNRKRCLALLADEPSVRSFDLEQ